MLSELVNSVRRELAPVFDMMEWGEDEISQARQRHPDHEDMLYHSFSLLNRAHDGMGAEFVYRSHARELLERVADRTDTRLATDAEMIVVLCSAAQVAPLNATGMGLVFRLWHHAFPNISIDLDDDQQHREALYGSTIDAAEAGAREALAVPERVLGVIECQGMHHGEPVACCYAPAHLPSREHIG